ncbi:methyl-accepting chemotaxis sensory transducer with Cache sensor [Halanaerobium congolense]|jgi:methyl-accepting chemotaxis protein|uniref:Methyl-accepting chemotaxis sensory transducer with Cache sensor n=1 Tax=Halanaerobium congolense TaxID=54121 RepID=A0A1G6S4I6_9FIRM|nr:methyl-accepting chemotaxis protein [Halanaerobium congolense]PTX16498.1 methyl-accepting chemotaxis sensory transducer with Cache sensor [Halanaerobium congolense]TDP26363.1 methyl-accepting chemotaxis protein [Halanaerobium congolense]SDD11105.1 methyl-accepting chemotaxis sensory transducer with Cache sensor [Halanaerobium congolense]SDF77540.1 methyl-accepting chemotaxis sensory transducer with Cache sensor [Halanaerobium congolense]SET08282.1 methyl-accepting chemotaxis sensory transdu
MEFDIKKINWQSIKTKLIIIISLLVLILIALSTTITYFQTKNILEESIYSSALDKIQSSAAQLDMVIDQGMNAVENVDHAWFDTRVNLPTSLARELYYKVGNNARFKNIVKNNEYLNSMFILDLEGVMSITSTEEDIDFSDNPVFKQALESKEIFISNPLTQPGGSKEVIMIIEPYFVEEKLATFFGGTITLNKLNEFAATLNINGSGHGFIINQDNYLLAYEDEKYIGNQQLLRDGGEEVAQLFNNMQNDLSQIEFYNLMGIDSGVAYAPLNNADWSIGIKANNQNVLSPLIRLRYISLIIGIIAVLIGTAVAYYLADYISKPIIELRNTVNFIANGDLTKKAEVENNDEIGELAADFNKMVDNIKKLIDNISSSAVKTEKTGADLKVTAAETSSAVDSVAASIEEFSASIEEVAASAQEFASTSSNINENVQGITEYTDEVNELAENGLLEMQKTEKEMENILNVSAESIDKINNLNASAGQINGIVNMISAIAEQTNLLALNAAIEAARAGDAGRGFAVVADEIRDLAEETKGSTNEIKNLVSNLQEEIKDAVKVINNTNSQIKEGADSVASTGKSFNHITDKIKDVVTQVKNTAEAVDELNRGSKDISRVTEEQAVNSDQISESVQKQSVAVDNLNNAVGSLTEMTVELKELVNEFKIS